MKKLKILAVLTTELNWLKTKIIVELEIRYLCPPYPVCSSKASSRFKLKSKLSCQKLVLYISSYFLNVIIKLKRNTIKSIGFLLFSTIL